MREPIDFFVPGRLCLFGEHTDWAGEYREQDPSVQPGRCIIAPTDQGIYARASAASMGFTIRQPGPDPERIIQERFPDARSALAAAREAVSFNSYAAGTAALVMEELHVEGVELQVVRRTLPLRKGLSSSAAVCVATVRAFNRLFQLGMSVREEMEYAYRGELLTGSRCGRMDQACAVGGAPVILTFHGKQMDLQEVTVSGSFHFLVVDLKRGKDTRRILKSLNEAFQRGEPSIREALGIRNHQIVDGALQAMSQGDAACLGDLMNRAQEVFDSMVAPHCPEELTAPVLHRVLRAADATGLSLGGKGVGSQGDGTAQLLCRGLGEREELKDILESRMDVQCCSLTI